MNMGKLAKAVFEELKLSCPRAKDKFTISALIPAQGDRHDSPGIYQSFSNAVKFTRPKEISSD